MKKGSDNAIKKVDINVLKAKRPANLPASALALLGGLDSGA